MIYLVAVLLLAACAVRWIAHKIKPPMIRLHPWRLQDYFWHDWAFWIIVAAIVCILAS
jgi:uncharacterized membrane protein SpoIIM required for sporulation